MAANTEHYYKSIQQACSLYCYLLQEKEMRVNDDCATHKQAVVTVSVLHKQLKLSKNIDFRASVYEAFHGNTVALLSTSDNMEYQYQLTSIFFHIYIQYTHPTPNEQFTG